MNPLEILPATTLSASGPASVALLAHGCSTVREAAEKVWRLPYARNSSVDEMLVLSEARGSCTTKHALLARCAQEQHERVDLMLCVSLMTARNTPRVASILNEAGLDSLPEAHCMLRYQGHFLDCSNPRSMKIWPESELLAYEVLEGQDLGGYKANYHRFFIDGWSIRHHTNLRAAQLWALRERCMAVLMG